MSPDYQQRLLRLARRALEARVRGEAEPPADGVETMEAYGAFVSIHRDGDLRGCLGRLESDSPLTSVVVHLATVVADSDPRFEPVVSGELDALDIEISLLSPPREVHAIDAVEVGRHGLIVEHGSRHGLLLPQVPLEHGWDRQTFVEQACRKAGLPSGAWRTGAKLFVFEAEIFSERRTAPLD